MDNKLQEAFDAIRAMAQEAQDIFPGIDVGSMPAGDRLCMRFTAGAEEDMALDLRGDLNMDMVVNARHRNQRDAWAALCAIHRHLTRTRPLPYGDGWQVLDIATSSAPAFIEQDGDQYLFGSGLEVLIYIE